MEYPEPLSRGQGGDVSRLQAAGIDGYSALAYYRAGVTTVDDMLTLHAAGIGGYDARSYHAADVTTLAGMQQLKAAGIDGYEARSYHAADVTTLAAMQQLMAAGIDGYDARRYREVGVAKPTEMLRLTKMGGTPSGYLNIAHARKRSGDEVVDRVLTVGDDLNRFPTGTLNALGRPSRLADDLLAASDGDLRVAVVLAEDQYVSTGEVSVPFIRQSIGLL